MIIVLYMSLCMVFFSRSVGYSQNIDLVATYVDEARTLSEQNKYLEAASTYRVAAELEKAESSPRIELIHSILLKASDCCRLVGRYDEAVKYDQEALELSQKKGDKRTTFSDCNRVGFSYRRLGKYDEALEHYQMAMQIGEELGEQDPVLISNIALIHHLWGQDKKALEYVEQATNISEKSQTEDVLQLLNLSQIFLDLNQIDKAFEYAQRGMRGRSKIEIEVTGIDCLINMTKTVEQILATDPEVVEEKNLTIARSFVQTLGKNDIFIFPEEGEDFIVVLYKKMLEDVRPEKLDALVSRILNEIGHFYHYRARVDERAFRYYQEALKIDRNAGREDWVAARLKNLGQAHIDRAEFDRAIGYLEEAVQILEKLRKTATGDIRRDYLASQIETYQNLIFCYARTGNYPNAFHTVELSRAKLLAERMAQSKSEVAALSIETLQKEIPDNAAVLVYANIDRVPQKNMVQMAIIREDIHGMEVPCSTFVTSALQQYGTAVKSLLEGQRGLAKKPKVEESAVATKEIAVEKTASEFGDIINYYRLLLINPSPENDAKARTLARMLYDILIHPMVDRIRGKDRLIIVPDGVLGFLPFETLVDENGHYLTESRSITYAQSMGVWQLARQRLYEETRKSLLALGGAVYDRVTYDIDMVENDRQLAYLQHQISNAINTRSPVRDAYAALGTPTWENLPGTLSEVQAIQRIIPETELLTGEEVNENRIKQLSTSGQLARYSVLHFATHGLVVMELPELSALVLAQFQTEQDSEDGYLRMEEISALDLRADFVNLSACETGLGKIYGGEGVVGLTQSFLIAGANSLSVSLWQVADESTAQFMVAMYDLVTRRGKRYPEAITEVKRRFIQGDFSEEYAMPFYWAPFVY